MILSNGCNPIGFISRIREISQGGGHKRVENRPWRMRHRGELAIHASAPSARSRAADAEARAILASLGVTVPDEVPSRAVVGTVDVVDVVELQADEPTLFDAADLHDDPLAVGPYCCRLENAVAFDEPVPAKGQQTIWEWGVDTSQY